MSIFLNSRREVSHFKSFSAVFQFFSSALFIILCTYFPFNALQAQDAQSFPSPTPSPSQTLQEIIIRGANREAPLLQVPTSITVIEGKNLRTLGQSHFDDITSSIPNFTAAGGSNRSRFFQIRGVGEVEQYEGAPNPSVGVIIDDIDLSGLGGIGNLFDIDSLEVLKGPQVARFGSNALAGLVNIRSIDPSPLASGQARISTGNDELIDGGIAMGGAVPGTNQDIQFRFAASQHSQDGFRNNEYVGQGDTNHRNEFASKAKLRWTPQSSFQADLTGLFFDFDNGYDAFSINNGFSTQSDRPGDDVQRTGAGALKLTYREPLLFEAISLTTLSNTDQNYSYDGDWGNNSFWAPYVPYDYFSFTSRERKNVAQEFRLLSHTYSYVHGNSWQWSVGTLASRLSEDTDTREDSEGIAYDSFESSYRSRTGAIFGSVEAPLSHNTSATFTFREERRLMEFDDSRGSGSNPGDSMRGGGVTLRHELNNNEQVYLGATRGFKGGGFNLSPHVPDERKVYTPEYLWNIEGGHKGRYFDGRITTMSSLFLMVRRDAQSQISFQDNPSDPLSFTYVTDNTSRGYNTGLEEEIKYKVTDSVNFTGVGSLLFTEYTSVDASQEILDGRAQSYAPRWKYRAGTEYRIQDSLILELFVDGMASFYFADSNNEQSTPSHQVSSSLSYRWKNITLALWSRNIFNEKTETRGFFFGNEPPDFPSKRYVQRGDPRSFGATATYVF